MGKIESSLDRVAGYLSRTSAIAVCASIFMMGWLISVNVLMRLFLNAPMAFVEEYSGFIYVFIVFMGFGWATRTDWHISVSLFYNRLSKEKQDILNVITSILSLIVVGIYLLYACDVFIYAVQVKERSVITYTPFWIPKLAMCLGLLFFVLEIVVRLIKFINLLKDSTKRPSLAAS